VGQALLYPFSQAWHDVRYSPARPHLSDFNENTRFMGNRSCHAGVNGLIERTVIRSFTN